MATEDNDVNDAIAALWQRQRAEMLRRVAIVEQAIATLGAEEPDREQLEEAERAAHKIAGAAGSFGFTEASRLGREIELALRAGVQAGDAPRLTEMAQAIRGDFDESAVAVPDSESAPAVTTTETDVLIVGGSRIDEDQTRAEL